MKSASNFLIFLILLSVSFNSVAQKSEPKSGPLQRAYVLLRSEGSEKEINELTSVLNSDFVSNNIAPDIKSYALGTSWTINQFIATAHNNNYDYIVLIDQVARFTTDKKTNIGGKYHIRKYPVKSSNPDWVDLGQKSCNISVRYSIDEFSKQITREIAPNNGSSRVLNEKEDPNIIVDQKDANSIDYNKLKSSEDLNKEITELKKELDQEKERTKKALSKKKLLEKEHKKELNIQKHKNETIAEELEARKRKLELEEIERQKELQLSTNERKEEPSLKEAEKLKKNFKLKDSKKKNLKQEKSITSKSEIPTLKKNKDTISDVSANRSNVLIIIRGQDEDHGIFKELQENMELELLSANIKASTHILNTKQAFDEERVLNWNKSKYDYLLLINQMREKENGASVFKISIYSEQTNSKWHDLNEKSYDLSDPKSLKELSNSVLKLH